MSCSIPMSGRAKGLPVALQSPPTALLRATFHGVPYKPCCVYRVGHLVVQLGWVDLDLECSTILLGQ